MLICMWTDGWEFLRILAWVAQYGGAEDHTSEKEHELMGKVGSVLGLA